MRNGRLHQAAAQTGCTARHRFVSSVTSLQCKTTGLVVVLTLSVTAVVSGYFLRSSGEFARYQHDTQMVQMATMLAKAAATMIAKGDGAALETLAEESVHNPPLLYVIFSDVDGRQLAVAERRSVNVLQGLYRDKSERAPMPGKPVFHQAPDGAEMFLDVTYPIVMRASGRAGVPPPPTRLLGYVRTGMVASRWHEAMSNRLDLVVGIGALVVVAAVPVGFFLVRRLIAPLDGLADAMLRFSEGNLDVRSPVRRRDEIGRLALAFNRMADQHQQTHERIVRLNAELEKRVAQRTQQLRELASREPLTGLYNRRFFNEVFERRFAEAARYGMDLSCVMVDLDGFKPVNDAFGHHVGDELLILTGATITSQLRSADVAARFGGDEFIVMLPHTDADQARVLAERIAEKFAGDVEDQLPEVRVTMSMGIASLPSPGIVDADSLIRAADHALYEAKAGGKNRIITAPQSPKPAPI